MSPTIARPQHSHFRWTVCALLFFATTINYVDRQVLSMLADTLKIQIGWTAIEYSNITTAFSIAYMVGLLGAGDRVWITLFESAYRDFSEAPMAAAAVLAVYGAATFRPGRAL